MLHSRLRSEHFQSCTIVTFQHARDRYSWESYEPVWLLPSTRQCTLAERLCLENIYIFVCSLRCLCHSLHSCIQKPSLRQPSYARTLRQDRLCETGIHSVCVLFLRQLPCFCSLCRMERVPAYSENQQQWGYLLPHSTCRTEF